jgi:hypothetical protein
VAPCHQFSSNTPIDMGDAALASAVSS